jgi:hypothetical protein
MKSLGSLLVIAGIVLCFAAAGFAAQQRGPVNILAPFATPLLLVIVGCGLWIVGHYWGARRRQR